MLIYTKAAQVHRIALEAIELPEAKHGFVLLPRCWMVERAFAWAACFRRLAPDYERLPTTLASLDMIAFAILLLTILSAVTLRHLRPCDSIEHDVSAAQPFDE